MNKFNYLALIICLIITTKSLSQITYNKILDEKNGFKDFKINDDYSKWINELEYTNSADDGIKYYDYKGNCCERVFTYDLESIRLGFKNNKLVVIYLSTLTKKDYSENWISSEFKSLKWSFEELFEEKTNEFPVDDNSGDVKCGWIGKNIHLSLTFEYMGLKKFGDEYIKTTRCNILIGKRVSLNSEF